MWVVDAGGNVSMGSNEVQAEYTVPHNTAYPFEEDGESGASKWSFGAPWGLTTIPANESRTGFTTTVWTDSPAGSYPANAETTLATFVDLSEATTPVLTFWNRYSLEEGYDFVYLEVSIDNGLTWSVLRTITGIETEWNLERVNLTPYAANSKVGLRFRLKSNGTTQQEGWFMDDLTIEEGAVEAPYPFHDDMEQGAAPWFYGSPWGLKTITADESHSGVTSTVWTDSPAGVYTNNADTSLQLTIDLGAADMPVLSFRHRYTFDTTDDHGDADVENADYGYVEVRKGTGSWVRYYFISGSTADWLYEKIDLSGFAGEKIDIRFRVKTNSSIQADGWEVDDIRIDQTQTPPISFPFFDDLEGGTATAANWQTSSWELAPGGYDSANAFTDSPVTFSGNQVYSRLVMANSIDLRGAIHPQLTFRHKYDFVNYGYDGNEGRVYISTNKGRPGTWILLKQFFEQSGGWIYTQIDLSDYSSYSNARIMFDIYDDKYYSENHSSDGWTIDDISIEDAPHDVVLTIAATAQNAVSLTWTQNIDPDFADYGLYRSSSPNVTRSNTLVATIPANATTAYTDHVAMIQPGVYYR